MTNTPLRVASFDIFDTVLTRSHIHPTHVFLDVGATLRAHGLWPTSADEFRKARIAAELAARGGDWRSEVRLREIIGQLCDASDHLDPDSVNQIIEVELEAERASLYPARPGVDALAEARDAFDAIVFVSDMYLPSTFIIDVLSIHGLWHADDQLMVSAEHGASKATGALFGRVAKRFPAGTRFTHHGDSKLADITRARRAGWRAVEIADARPTRYETLDPDTVDLPTSLLLGDLRRGRLADDDARFRAAFEVGVGVLGPTLLSFGLWLSERARADGIDHIYCLARDGQVIKLTLDALAEAGVELPPRTYLMASRIALRRPAAAIARTAPSWLFEESGNLSARTVLQRMDVDEDEWFQYLRTQGLKAERDAPLTDTDAALLRREAASGPLFDAFMAEAEAQLDAARRHFAERGLTTARHPAICDVGWFGSMQAALGDILTSGSGGSPGNPDPAQSNPARLAGYYLGLVEHPPHRAERITAAWLDDAPDTIALPRFGELTELLLSADHGGVLRYGPDGPELGATDGAAIDRLQHLRRGVEVALDCARRHQPLPAPVLRSLAIRNLEAFMMAPDDDEAEVFGGWPISIDATHDHHRELAPAFTVSSALREARHPSGHGKFWAPAIRRRSTIGGNVFAEYLRVRRLVRRVTGRN